MCDHCRATSYLSHPITGCTLTRLTGAGQSPFCSLAATVSHVAREHWLEVFWIILIGSRYRSAHWDLWNRTIGGLGFAHVSNMFLFNTSLPGKFAEYLTRSFWKFLFRFHHHSKSKSHPLHGERTVLSPTCAQFWRASGSCRTGYAFVTREKNT